MLSARAEPEHARQLLPSGRGIGYLLKSRVTDVTEFIDTLRRIANGGSVVDPALVQELVSARRRNDPHDRLSAREREVLSLTAQGCSNAGIAHRLWMTEGTVEKHVRSILTSWAWRSPTTTTAVLARIAAPKLRLGQEPDRPARRDHIGLSTVRTLPAGAAIPQCGPHCSQIFSAKFGTNANPGFVETVFQEVAAAGQPTIAARSSSSNPAGDLIATHPASGGLVSDFFAAGLVSAAVNQSLRQRDRGADRVRAVR